MRTIKWILLGAIGVALLVLALANGQSVTVQLLPAEIDLFAKMNMAIDLPLFLVILLAVAVGIIIGFIWEWLREHKHRAEAARKGREVNKLERKVSELRPDKGGESDDVLALLEDTGTRR